MNHEKNISINNQESDCNKMEYPPVYVNVPPLLMTWLRESTGYSQPEISEKLDVPIEYVMRWETGGIKPTIEQLKQLSKIFKISLSAFYQSEPPTKTRELPKDYRRLPDSDKIFTKKTLQGIRKSQYFQEISNELLENLNCKTKPLINFVDCSYDEESLSIKIRQEFEFTTEHQKELPNDADVFKELIGIIERKNIFIFQFSMVKKELRGFTLMDMEPYVIVINSSDDPRAKIFTLIHEYGHILLNKPGICIPNSESIIDDNDDEAIIEKWCNNLAGCFLIQKKTILEDFKLYGIENIKGLANKYKVSQYAMIIRLKKLNIISYAVFKNVEIALKQKNKQDDESSFGRSGTSVERAVRQKGKLFCSVVMQNVSNHSITDSTALDYLEIKLKNVDQLQKLL